MSTERSASVEPEIQPQVVQGGADVNSGESFRGFGSIVQSVQGDSVTSTDSDSQEGLLFGSIDFIAPEPVEFGGMAEGSRDSYRRANWVFSGKAFSQWRERVEAVLAREGLKALTWNTPEEQRYCGIASTAERYRQMRQYDRQQDRARDIIYEHVDDQHLDRIRDCVTAREMLEKLEGEHRSKSDVAITSAFGRLEALRYNRGTDLKVLLDEYELRVREYRDLGGTINEREMIHRFHKLLPVLYDTVMDWFPTLPEQQRTFANYREKILEKHQRTSLMSSEHRRAPSEKSVESPESNQPTKKEDGDHGGGSKKCYVCKESGHVARNCPLISKVEEKVAALKVADDAKTKESLKAKDWSQFRTHQLQKAASDRPAPTHSV